MHWYMEISSDGLVSNMALFMIELDNYEFHSNILYTDHH